MRLVRRKDNEFVFLLGKREKNALCHLLGRYPMVPEDYNTLSRTGDLVEMRVDEELLAEALAATRQESKRAILELVEADKHFTENSRGWRLKLTQSEMDWLLQVLGDIRVGSWLKLGCPEEHHEHLEKLTPKELDLFVAMEMSGSLQMFLLHALHSGDALEEEGEHGNTEGE